MGRIALALTLTILLPMIPVRAAPAPIEVGPGIDPPKRLAYSAAPFVDNAKYGGASGSVVVRAVIDSLGHVNHPEVVWSPSKRLSKAALAAMSRRTYAPAMRDGEPVAVWWTETLEFVEDSEEVATILKCDLAHLEVGESRPTENVSLPVLLRDAMPVVTDKMRRQHKRGHVILECAIDACGRVRRCHPLESIGEDFSASAIAAVEHRVYRPATRVGKPMEIIFTIRVEF